MQNTIRLYPEEKYDKPCYADFIIHAQLQETYPEQIRMLSDLTDNYMDYPNYQNKIHEKLEKIHTVCWININF